MLETVRVPVAMIQPKKAFADATRASARILEREGRRIGYVHLWSSTDVEVLRDALQRIGDAAGGAGGRGRNRGGSVSALADRIDWLVIDMRGKVGGYASVPGAFLDVIDPPERRIGIRVTTTRDGQSVSEAARSLRGRTALLIDRKTRSAGEIFAHGFKRAKLGPSVGATTAGAVIAGRAFVMPGETLLYVAIRGLEIDGVQLEGKGVEPDVRVERPLPYADGADPVLDAALSLATGK
jgi:carboxyl-terminal processing protease